jgi:ribosomal protein L11 methyltransferase
VPPPGALVEDVAPGWQGRWRDFHRPVRVGPLWIGPPWLEPPSGVRSVVIDPGRAFGTGAHPTTHLCVEFLAELEPGALLDVGSGSGVIAIAGAVLGFSPVFAVDVDPAAVDASTRNAAANGVTLDVRQLDLTASELPAADVAVANISLGAVAAVLARIGASLVITSGYLVAEEPECGSYRRRERRTRDGWAADLYERAE